MRVFSKNLYGNKGLIKNVCILFLCIATVVQTYSLWFVNLSNGSSTFTSKVTILNLLQLEKNFSYPYRILTSLDGNSFSQNYSTTSNMWVLCTNIMDKTITSGSFKEKGKLSKTLFQNAPIAIFDYTYSINGQLLSQSVNIHNGNTSKIDTFNMLIMKIVDDNSINVYFVDRKNSTYSMFNIDNNNFVKSLKDEMVRVTSDVKYTFNFNTNKNIGPYQLVPYWNNSPLNYKPLVMVNPYATEYGDITRSAVESGVDLFFKRPLSKNYTAEDNEYIFSDTDTKVIYFEKGMLEYDYYDLNNKTPIGSVVNDYATALNFIKNSDTKLENKYFLQSYSHDSTSTIFKFNYIVNDYPLYFSSDMSDKIGIDCAFEVTVKNNNVSKYRKIVYNFAPSDSSQNKAFITATSAIGKISGDSEPSYGTDNFIKNIRIGYKLDTNKSLSLYWFMEAYGNKYIYSTQ